RLGGPRPGRLLDRVLDRRPVDHREQRLRNHPGRGSHPGAAPGRRDDRHFDAHVATFCSEPWIMRMMFALCRKRMRATIKHSQRKDRLLTPMAQATGSVVTTTMSDAMAATRVNLTRTSHPTSTPRPSHGRVKKRTPRPV